MKGFWSAALAAATLLTFATSGAAHAVVLSSTDFETFTLGSVDGQGGWSAASKYDEEVVDDGSGNQALRISNAVASGSFGDQPFAPRPGGTSMDTMTDPVGGNPSFFAGETSTGAAFDRFFAQFDYRSATGSEQPGAFISVSADNGQGGRQSYFGLTGDGSIITYDLDSAGNFGSPVTLAAGVGYNVWTTLGVEILFNDGLFNDVVNYYIEGALVHTNNTWESFYVAHQSTRHPLGVPVQSLIFRAGGTGVPGVAGGGFLFDNVLIEAGARPVPEPAPLALLLGGLVALGIARRRKPAVA